MPSSQKLGPYDILASIGAGGMGEVFRARDTRLNRDVAVKVLPKDFASDADRLRRFEQEAKMLAALNHPNVLTIHDAGVHEGAPYLVSELLEGKTLREEMNGGALSVRKATEYALQITHGLAAAHGKGVIHRDLKPENIFVTKDGRVKILDFGLAKLRTNLKSEIRDLRSAEPEAVTVVEKTEPGMVLGTPAYMSPEQVRGEPADHRADIFAFGCVLYEMLSGTRAFRRDTPIASMNAVLSEEPPELRASNATMPPLLERVLRRCLEKRPDNRFQSAKDLAFAIESTTGLSAGSTNVSAQRRPGRRGLRMAFAGGALLVVVLVAFLIGRTQRPLAPTQPAALNWRGERLEGPAVGFTPRLSPDGKELALSVMVNGLNQLAVMIVDSGDWKILTTNRSRGLIGEVCWASNGSEIYYSHIAGNPNGVYRISRLGGEERLVLERADDPQLLADGSILTGKRDPDGNYRLYLFSTDTEQSRPLNAFPRSGFTSGRALLPDRDAAIFWGRTNIDTKMASSLWRINVKSGETRPFLTHLTRTFQFRATDTFSVSHDGRYFLFTQTAEPVRRLFSVDLQAPHVIRPLLPLTALPTAVNMDRSGNLFLDQTERPYEILRRGANGAIERIPLPPGEEERWSLALPNGRFLLALGGRGSSRLMVFEPGKELRPFQESRPDAGAPFARLGSNQVLFTVREGSRFVLARASLNGRGVKIIEQVSCASGDTALAMAGAPDGKAIYYAVEGSVYSIPVSGGEPQKLCAGKSIAVDPHGQYLVVKVESEAESYLIRYSLSDGAEQRIPNSGRYPLSGGPLGPAAIGPDGRIAVRVSPLDSWFWPAAILDPRTGEMELATEVEADMISPGWDDQGRFVTSALFFRSSLWRFYIER